jgi:hypothetical protein
MATIKKAQKGKTVMQKLKAKYPKADTTAAGDTRFQEYNAYAPQKFLDQIKDTDDAFNKKYGKGKPAIDKKPVKKQRAGGVTKASSKTAMMKTGGIITPTKKSVGKTIGKLNKAKDGHKMVKTIKKK